MTGEYDHDSLPAVVSNEISGGVFFHAVIQGRDITVQLPPQITPALSGLPASSPTFVGRDNEVETLLQTLAPDCRDGKPTLVSAVAGLAGVGKTELVLQVAHEALGRNGWFPGGALFVDLFGYDNDRRLSPEHALDGLLRALGIPDEHIPAHLQDRSQLYRSVLTAYAEQGKRILVVIDNTSAADQIRPLLPSDGATKALVTSRHTLDVGARLHDLDILGPDAAVDLIRQALHHARGSDDTRVDAELQQAKTIAELCGRLPLALQIVAALLADIPTRPLASVVEDLSHTQDRLGGLQREAKAVRAAFHLSYQHLNVEQARLFRFLPLSPGPDISTEAAAYLTGDDQPTARRLLQDLARAHLIEPGQTWDRWHIHDLIRLYAYEQGRSQAEAGERNTALERLCGHYVVTAKAASAHLHRLPVQGASNRFQDRTDALAWLEVERSYLTAIVTSSPSLLLPDACVALVGALDRFFDWRGCFDDWIAVDTAALHSVRRENERRGEGTVLNHLGVALRQVRRLNESIEAHTQAQTIFQELGDRDGEAQSVDNLGTALQDARRFDEAIEAHTQARTIFQEIGDRHGEGMALTNLGLALAEVRRFDEAIEAHTQARTIDHEIGDRHGEGMALTNLGLALAEVRRFDEAIETHAQARTIFHEHHDRRHEVRALGNLGLVLCDVQRFDEAIDTGSQAAAAFEDLGDDYSQAGALTNLGNYLSEVRRFDEAIDVYAKAASIFRRMCDRHSEGIALENLARALLELRRFEDAVGAHGEAAAAFGETGDRHNEAMVLDDVSLLLWQLQRFDEAITTHIKAATAYLEIGDRQREGVVMTRIGALLWGLRRFDEAIDASTQAVSAFREIGDLYSQAKALSNVGNAARKARHFRQAIEAYEEAAAIYQDTRHEREAETVYRYLSLAHNELWRRSHIA